ncbi:MAG: 50S ribosomal protein L21 [Patescibacteria group bacterium]
MTYIVKSGSHQYMVNDGDLIEVEKIELNEGEVVELPVLVSFIDGKSTLNPGSKKARVVTQTKGDKIRVVKYRAKSKYHKQSGHRQKLTVLEILA